MTHILILLAFLVGISPSFAEASVIFSQTFEGFAANDGCTEMRATDSNITNCRANTATNDLTIKTSIPGYAGSFPSGSKVMRGYVDSTGVQGDVGLAVGDAGSSGYDNYLPADVWFQTALYINNTGSETSVVTDRPMKLFYPCRDNYPCNTNYFLIETAVGTSHNPLCDTSLAGQTNGNMYLVMRDSFTFAGQGTMSYPTGCSATNDKLGQTSLAEWIKPGRWNVIRCHLQSSDTSSPKIDCWIGAMGSALVNVMSWHGGTPVAGQSFTWSVPTAAGHRAAWLPSTQPANNATGGTHYFYYDDYYVATLESDLPTYGASSGSGGSGVIGGVRFNGTVRIQ